VLSSAIRTRRGASESARHAIRYPAHASGLDFHEHKLTETAKKLRPDSTRLISPEQVEQVMLELWGSEQIMAAEHREWLRLMQEAEWYG
jgi:hypothetical protein